MTAERMFYRELRRLVKGGAGSGNFGHAGRPGEQGGSSSGGGPAVARGGVEATGLGAVVASIRQPGGGFTYHAGTGQTPKTGFAVAVYRGRESAVHDAKTVTVENLTDYAIKNWDVLSQADNYFGGWHNPVDGKIYLDISRVVASKAEALKLGLQHDQYDVFDLSKGESIPVIGPGSRHDRERAA